MHNEIKKVRDCVLREYATSVLEFEVLMSQRRAGMFSIGYDQAMTDWCVSSNNRFAFSRVITLAAFKKKPMRKSAIAKTNNVRGKKELSVSKPTGINRRHARA